MIDGAIPVEAGAALLAAYDGRPPDAARLAALRAMRCTSHLREAMWGMVSEIHGRVAADFAAYAEEHLGRFEREWAELGG